MISKLQFQSCFEAMWCLFTITLLTNIVIKQAYIVGYSGVRPMVYIHHRVRQQNLANEAYKLYFSRNNGYISLISTTMDEATADLTIQREIKSWTISKRFRHIDIADTWTCQCHHFSKPGLHFRQGGIIGQDTAYAMLNIERTPNLANVSYVIKFVNNFYR